jgi:hypothetical protein
MKGLYDYLLTVKDSSMYLDINDNTIAETRNFQPIEYVLRIELPNNRESDISISITSYQEFAYLIVKAVRKKTDFSDKVLNKLKDSVNELEIPIYKEEIEKIFSYLSLKKSNLIHSDVTLLDNPKPKVNDLYLNIKVLNNQNFELERQIILFCLEKAFGVESNDKNQDYAYSLDFFKKYGNITDLQKIIGLLKDTKEENWQEIIELNFGR